ncbi:hypothetical protein ACHAXH_009890 [Discostella pseudostelligera]
MIYNELAAVSYCLDPISTSTSIIIIIIVINDHIARRALEVLATGSDYSDSDTDSDTQLQVEERRIMSMIRGERTSRELASHVGNLIPSSMQNRSNEEFAESFLDVMARLEQQPIRSSLAAEQWLHLFSRFSTRSDAILTGRDGSSSGSGSSSSSMSDDDDFGDEIDLDTDSENDEDDDEEAADHQDMNNDLLEDEVEGDTEADRSTGNHDETTQHHNNIASLLQLLPPPSSITFDSNIRGTNNFQRISSLLVSLANSEENPLIRADIPWPVIIACGTPFMDLSTQTSSLLVSPRPSLLQTLYHQLDDPNGTRLLKGVLRMDPPLEVVKVLLDAFPLSCLDMEAFFTACQFAHPHTSRRSKGANVLVQDDGSEFDTDDVGEVIRLVMHETIRIRRLNNIDWGMVAFLGDARISPSHAKLLLQHFPEALNDSNHGTFEVSPLDRMASGYFIHGETTAWVEKLRIALRVAMYVRQRREQIEQDPTLPKEITMPSFFFGTGCQVLRRRESGLIGAAQIFYPYHELIRLIISPNFQGTRFGRVGFIKTLNACTESEPDAFLQMDDEGNLPIHIALRSKCETSLGVHGERRLIRYLLKLNPSTSLCLEGGESIDGRVRRLPLRLSIENGWPVFDLIINAALTCGSWKTPNGIDDDFVLDRPLLHDVLNGPYHPQFGIYFAREMVKFIIGRVSHHHFPRGQKRMRSLTNPVDSDGRTALHVALESKWPVYDLLAQAYPNLSLEVRDPSRFGFFPFQIAACDFAAGTIRKESPDIKVLIPGKSTDGVNHSTDTSLNGLAIGEEDRRELLELSMLFEIVRECPHCVTYSLDDLNHDDAIGPGPTKKRRYDLSSIES